MYNMNKGNLIDAIAASTGLSKADAGRAIDATTSAIAGELAGGGSVALVGFGTFSVSHRAARMGRNPATGESIHINASNVPKFKAGKALKEACN
jgi:DNA-binding protein HU-beta